MRKIHLIALLVGLYTCGAFALAAPTAPEVAAANPILHLINGDVAPGRLQDSSDPETIRWQCAPFTKPFDFNISGISAVHFPQPKQQPKATGEYGFELAGGDVLFGSLLSLNDKEVVIDSPTFGKLNLRRDHVRRLMRWGDAAGFVYVGPSGLSGWKEPTAGALPAPATPQAVLVPADPFGGPQPAQPAPAAPQQPAGPQQPQWWQESGHAVTDRPGASIYNDVGLPAKAIVEVELSWKNKPDFVLSLADSDGQTQNTAENLGKEPGVIRRPVPIPNAVVQAPGFVPPQPAAAEEKVGAAFRIEVLGANVILMRDLGTTADLVLLENLGPGAGRIHWQVYLDQERGRAAVYSAEGKPLNELVLDDKNAVKKIATGIRLINKRGDVRLERLRVSRWNGELPKQVEGDKSRVHKADGSLVYGDAKGYDPQRRQFIIAGTPKSPAESRLDADQVTSLVLSRADVSPANTVSATLQNGVRLSGNLTGIAGGQVKLTSPAIVEPIAIPIVQLQSLLTMNKASAAQRDLTWQSGDGTVRKVSKPEPAAAAQPAAGRVGRLEVDGLRLHGELVDGEAKGDASSLVWKPLGSKNGSPLKLNMSGRVVYRESAPRPVVQVQNQQQAAIAAARGRRIVNGRVVTEEPAVAMQPPASSTPSLHLRVGDNIPCEVKKIDAKGVTFHSPVTDATFIANEKVKAVELAPEQQTKNIGKTKRERLLTLPRMQKNNPPTHLVIAKNGDFLRGRLNEMNDKSLALEVRLEARELPRDKVSRIIWFHPETAENKEGKEGEPKAPPAPLGTGLVQTMRRDGARLTFLPERCDEGILSGKSEVLGQCRVDIALVDQILFGKAIDDAQVQLAYHPWQLHDAIEPKYVQEEANEGKANPSAGTESALVGKAAPDFDLPALGGGTIRLSGLRGTVVVLDFFATWCGPCVQAMPNIDRTVEEFKDKKVKLLAVNMQEDQKKIKDLLERLKLSPTVVMDRDGAAAEKYGVTAIPQTVVIDAEGKIARIFIGGGPKLPDQLAEAIKAVLNPAETTN